jgi:N-glycosylase/DNA lyase
MKRQEKTGIDRLVEEEKVLRKNLAILLKIKYNNKTIIFSMKI